MLQEELQKREVQAGWQHRRASAWMVRMEHPSLQYNTWAFLFHLP